MTDNIDRARQAPAPVEVSRLAKEARELLSEALNAAESAGHPLNHGRSRDAAVARDELLTIIRRLATMASKANSGSGATPIKHHPEGLAGFVRQLEEIRINESGSWERAKALYHELFELTPAPCTHCRRDDCKDSDKDGCSNSAGFYYGSEREGY